jgi:hypothetical protein
MFRKFGWVALVTIVWGASAATPGQAADLPGSYAPHPGPCPRFCNGAPVSFGYGLCYRQELHQTPWGPRWRLVNRCC